MAGFSLSRLLAIILKETIQMRRDRLTFAMMLGIPLMQLVLFGFAINTDPKSLPTAVVLMDHSDLGRDILSAMRNSGYFAINRTVTSEQEGERLLQEGEVQFVLTVPAGFTRALIRGDQPVLLLEADATDPAAAGNAISAIQSMVTTALQADLNGPLARLAAGSPPFELRIHRRYNPDGLSQYNVVPGLLGVILTMTMVMMTALAVTREHERGTMETLLAMPVRPAEVMLGKILPYIGLGYLQVMVVLVAAHVLFAVPMIGSLALLSALLLIFIAANLAVGLSFSALASNQLQAMQMSFFFFLPSLILSGFMFPFRGMPVWAQWVGQLFPLTHFLRVVRGILLKGNGLAEVWPAVWPQVIFLVVAFSLAVLFYRKTLD